MATRTTLAPPARLALVFHAPTVARGGGGVPARLDTSGLCGVRVAVLMVVDPAPALGAAALSVGWRRVSRGGVSPVPHLDRTFHRRILPRLLSAVRASAPSPYGEPDRSPPLDDVLRLPLRAGARSVARARGCAERHRVAADRSPLAGLHGFLVRGARRSGAPVRALRCAALRDAAGPAGSAPRERARRVASPPGRRGQIPRLTTGAG